MTNTGTSIRSKLVLILVSISAAVLVLAASSISVTYYQMSKNALIKNTQSQANLIANNATIYIANDNQEELNRLLNSLVINSDFAAAIFDNTGKIISSRNSKDIFISEAEFKKNESNLWLDDRLFLWQPILDDNKEFNGIVYLKLSTDPFYKDLTFYIMVSLAVVVIIMTGVFLVSFSVQKTISEPLVELERISRKISGSGNFSIRVPDYGDDEIGSLSRSFNQMLVTIERQRKEREDVNNAMKINKKRLERAVKDLQYLANYDSLTQLPNRALCMDRMKLSLKRAARENSIVAVLFLDLDHFKDVNDSLGHAVGDQLLKATSERLLEKIRNVDTLARLGGDEFVIILNSLYDTDDVINIAEKIVGSFEEPFRLSNYEVNTTVSVGICTYPNDGVDVDSLMKAADAAMYKAKESGRNTYEFFEAELNYMAIKRHQLANELRQAIKNGELSIVFQPQFNIVENRMIGSEVLVRWKHPILGTISPSEFVPIAENTGLIKEIGTWVLDNTCKQIVECRRLGFDIRFSVNLSVLQFKQADLPEQIAQTLKKFKIPPRLLEVEITESMLMRDVTQAIDMLERFKEMQIRIAIDDFGTGYSSLSYLRRFPLDALKIDSSFIDELVVSTEDTEITQAIISMAKSLHLDVIAEGVETQQQYDFLAENGCDNIQGYYFSKPLEHVSFIEFIKTRLIDDGTVKSA
ncbi:MAG: EAL domain-containing protein [Gammaproteobacteria bacterium]|nr:EAL domain-containing protein [Gammaproteobacteria bacterium]MDH5629248.1 EAL domain-containing protein [Gammaproteobacteria bacterium]